MFKISERAGPEVKLKLLLTMLVQAIASVLEDKMVKLTALYIAVISNSRSFDCEVTI